MFAVWVPIGRRRYTGRGKPLNPADRPTPNIDPSALLTELASGMAQLHEVFRSAVDAGFSEQQAMTIIVEMLRPRPAAS